MKTNLSRRILLLAVVLALVLPLAAFTSLAAPASAPQAAPAAVTCQVFQPASQDAYINSEKVNENKGNDNELRVKTEALNKLQQSLVQFDISGLPSGALVDSATLSLWVKEVRDGNVNINARPATKAWNESTVTWANFGSSYGAVVESEAFVKGVKNYWATWDVSNLAAAWISNPAANYGVVLESPVTKPKAEVRFKSSEDGTASQRPKLTICWSEGLSLGPDIMAQGYPGQTTTFAHPLRVGALTNEVVHLSALSSQGWAVRFYHDLNNNGLRDSGEPQITQTPPIGPNVVYPLAVEVDVPAAATNGTRDDITLTASGQNSGISDTATDRIQIGYPPLADPVLDGKKDAVYAMGNTIDYCDASGNNLARLMSTIDLANPDYVWVILEMDRRHVDNTYGTYAHESWAAAGKSQTLGNLDGSDAGQVILRNGAGTVIYDVTADYLETNLLGSAGINAAEGKYNVLPGNDLSLVGVESSIGYNLQTYCTSSSSCTVAGINLLQTSPAQDGNYISLDPTFDDWQYSYLYEFRFAAAPFGPSGFGNVSIDYVHVSPNKTGSNVITVTPCTGSIGDRVWRDNDQDGNQDGGEPGLNGVQVSLYRDNGDGVFNPLGDDLVGNKFTSGDGAYQFANLGADVYWVDVVDSTVPAGLHLTTANDPLKVTLAKGQNFTTADFGYAGQPEIAISKELSSGEPGYVGEEVVFTIRITNTGESLIDVLPLQDWYDPDLLQFVSSTPAPSSSVPGVLTWNDLTLTLGNVAPDGSVQVTLRFLALQATASTLLAQGAALGAQGALAPAATPIVDGLLDPSYSFLTRVNKSGTGSDMIAPGNLYRQETADKCYYAFVMDRGFNSNVYTDRFLDDPYLQLDGWTQNHNFDALLKSDHMGFDLTYPGGKYSKVILDYLNGSPGAWTSGQTGQDGSAAPGTGPMDAVGTSLQWNLNNSGWNGDVWGNPLRHSPPYDYFETTGKVWVWNLIYEWAIPKNKTGGQCGSLTITASHNSPNKDQESMGRIGDRVWEDKNLDGIQDPNEVGIPGVTLRLYQGGALLRITETEPGTSGYYIFNNLSGGSYVVDVDESTLPAGYSLTGGIEPRPVTLSSGGSFLNADFGYYFVGDGAIGDRVFYDLNGDGLPDNDANDPGINGVTVRLYQDACAADGVLRSTQVTTGNGGYLFTSLPAGAYCVRVDESTLPAGLSLTTANQPLTVNLLDDQTFLAADFGYRLQSPDRTCDLAMVSFATDAYGQFTDPVADEACVTILASGSIGDYVWNDANGNGIQDADEDNNGVPDVNEGLPIPLDGTTINLYRENGNGLCDAADLIPANFVASQVTAGGGLYSFTQLPPGQYCVDVDESTLGGYEFLPGAESGPKPHFVDLGPQEDYTTADFGYAGRGAISGVVFYDWDEDGIQGIGEDGIPNTELCLYADTDSDGLLDPGSSPLACQNTESDGSYLFPDYLPGAYLVAQTQPAGLESTTPNTLAVTLVVVGPSGSAPDNDFGEIVYSSIGDFIFRDPNGNGVQDPGENDGVPGVPVTVKNLTTLQVVTVPSDGSGFYLVTNLLPGTYEVEVPALWPGLVRTTVAPTTVTLGIDEHRLDVDFGYIAPTAVTLVNLSAEYAANGVWVRWATSFEQDQTGFRVWRSASADGVFKLVSPVLKAANSPDGSSYEWLDKNAIAGQTYWYRIESLPDGQMFGPVRVMPDPGAAGNRVFIPIIVR